MAFRKLVLKGRVVVLNDVVLRKEATFLTNHNCLP